MVIKLHSSVHLLLFVWAKGKDVLLLSFALSSKYPAEHQAGAAPVLDSGSPSLCCL